MYEYLRKRLEDLACIFECHDYVTCGHCFHLSAIYSMRKPTRGPYSTTFVTGHASDDFCVCPCCQIVVGAAATILCQAVGAGDVKRLHNRGEGLDMKLGWVLRKCTLESL